MDVQRGGVDRVLYRLRQIKSRALVPKISALVFLGGLFFIGILLNVALLEVSAEVEQIVMWVSLSVVLILAVVGIVFSIRRASLEYLFYHDRIVIGTEVLYYKDIANIEPEGHLFDRMFKTHSFNLGHHFHVRHISRDVNLHDYLGRLVAYAKNSVTR